MASLQLNKRITDLKAIRQHLMLMENKLEADQEGKTELQDALGKLDESIKILRTLPTNFKA